jgi:hypothetical protein
MPTAPALDPNVSRLISVQRQMAKAIEIPYASCFDPELNNRYLRFLIKFKPTFQGQLFWGNQE